MEVSETRTKKPSALERHVVGELCVQTDSAVVLKGLSQHSGAALCHGSHTFTGQLEEDDCTRG